MSLYYILFVAKNPGYVCPGSGRADHKMGSNTHIREALQLGNIIEIVYLQRVVK